MTRRTELSPAWELEPGWSHLNHGSYGARTTALRTYRAELTSELERNPVLWRETRFPALLAEAKSSLARALELPLEGLALVPQVTSGVTAALRAGAGSTSPGDELLVLEHTYGSCRTAAEQVAREHGLVVREVPFPTEPRSGEDLARSVLEAVGPHTRLALLDHVSSRTGAVYPLERLVNALDPSIEVVVDGAHGPGLLPLPATLWDRITYVGAGYKWLCGPLGSAFLVSSRVRLPELPGAIDPVPWLTLPRALDELSGSEPERLEAIARTNSARAEAFAAEWHDRLGEPEPLPGTVQSAMRLLRLPASLRGTPLEELTRALRAERIETKVTSLRGETMVRLSVQSYVEDEDVDRLWSAVLAASRSAPPASA